jgi:hypothetical protein
MNNRLDIERARMGKKWVSEGFRLFTAPNGV